MLVFIILLLPLGFIYLFSNNFFISLFIFIYFLVFIIYVFGVDSVVMAFFDSFFSLLLVTFFILFIGVAYHVWLNFIPLFWGLVIFLNLNAVYISDSLKIFLIVSLLFFVFNVLSNISPTKSNISGAGNSIQGVFTKSSSLILNNNVCFNVIIFSRGVSTGYVGSTNNGWDCEISHGYPGGDLLVPFFNDGEIVWEVLEPWDTFFQTVHLSKYSLKPLNVEDWRRSYDGCPQVYSSYTLTRIAGGLDFPGVPGFRNFVNLPEGGFNYHDGFFGSLLISSYKTGSGVLSGTSVIGIYSKKGFVNYGTYVFERILILWGGCYIVVNISLCCAVRVRSNLTVIFFLDLNNYQYVTGDLLYNELVDFSHHVNKFLVGTYGSSPLFSDNGVGFISDTHSIFLHTQWEVFPSDYKYYKNQI